MKHLLTSLLFFIGLAGLAQPTYLDLFIQFDQYPGETSWTLAQDTIPLITSPDYGFQEYVGGTTEQTLFLEAGVEYTFTITDDFGDGICCGFMLSNLWKSSTIHVGLHNWLISPKKD